MKIDKKGMSNVAAQLHFAMLVYMDFGSKQPGCKGGRIECLIEYNFITFRLTTCM